MTPNLPGEILIVFALAGNIVAGLGFLMVARGKSAYEKLAQRGYLLFTLFTAFAVAYLYYLFYSHNFAIKYVWEYSDRAQPTMYILSAFWGGQEGTYLLWLLFNALFGFIIVRRGGQYKNHAMAIYSLVNLFFLLILVRLSPFALNPTLAGDGEGLNPLLRDPWMIVHPPVIFIGYSIAAVPFALAVAALLTNDYSSWLRKAFPWVALSVIALGAGNILGGFWAYKTLGWGGFWGWDPVENSSFVPWVFALALLHGMIIERRTGALRKSNLLLASFVFLLVVYGTFLTRSGVLADFSVHSFTDLGINNYLVAFMVVTLLLTVVPLLIRFRSVPVGPLNYNLYGREFSLFAGMVVLALFGIVVLAWTSLPLLTKLVGAAPRAADVATYNHFAVPLVVVMSLLLGVAPLIQYGEFKPHRWVQRILYITGLALAIGFGVCFGLLHTDVLTAVLVSFVVVGIGVYLLRSDLRKRLILPLVALAAAAAIALISGVREPLYLVFLATGAMAAVANIISLVEYLPGRWKLMGGQLTHFGFGVMVIGILASTAFPDSQKLMLGAGRAGEAYGLNITYEGMVYDLRHPNNELKLQIEDHGSTTQARPQLYFSERMQGTMRKPYIHRTLLSDLYMAPEEIMQADTSAGLIVHKGETKQIGDLKITFDGFAMGQHGDSVVSTMHVGAKLIVEAAGKVDTVEPAVEQGIGGDGRMVQNNLPAEIKGYGDNSYSVQVGRILADQGAVELIIPGVTSHAGGENLVLDISRKPLINLVWAGALLTIIGSIIVFVRRREEMSQKTRVPAVAGPAVPAEPPSR